MFSVDYIFKIAEYYIHFCNYYMFGVSSVCLCKDLPVGQMKGLSLIFYCCRGKKITCPGARDKLNFR